MKRYADYTKDDLMLLLESLTPGGSEFHESPATCIEFVRARYAAGTSLVIKRGMAEKQRDSLLALLEKIDSLLAEWKNLNYINYGKMQSRFDEDLERVELEIEEAIAAAKGEA